MDRSLFVRAAIVQALAVVATALALALVLPNEFFEDWGWLAGPATWALCALVTARVLGLQPLPVLVGAALAGLPSIAAVIAGAHWLGAAIGIVFFAAWCARMRPALA